MIDSPVSGQAEGVIRAAPPFELEGEPVVALPELVERHFDFVFRSLRRLGVDDASLDDAVQQVWIVAARQETPIREGGARALLFAIALRVASDARRAMRRTKHVGDEDSVAAARDGEPLPDEALDRRRARAVLDEILDELADDLRAVFVLYELEQETVPEIATTLALPVGTVSSRLRRAREQFQAAVRRRAARNGGVR